MATLNVIYLVSFGAFAKGNGYRRASSINSIVMDGTRSALVGHGLAYDTNAVASQCFASTVLLSIVQGARNKTATSDRIPGPGILIQ